MSCHHTPSKKGHHQQMQNSKTHHTKSPCSPTSTVLDIGRLQTCTGMTRTNEATPTPVAAAPRRGAAAVVTARRAVARIEAAASVLIDKGVSVPIDKDASFRITAGAAVRVNRDVSVPTPLVASGAAKSRPLRENVLQAREFCADTALCHGYRPRTTRAWGC